MDTITRTPAGTHVEIERLPGRPPTANIRCVGERWTYRVTDGVARLVDGTTREPDWIDSVLREVGAQERGPPLDDGEDEEEGA